MQCPTKENVQHVEQQFISLLPDDQAYLVRRVDGIWLNVLFQPASEKNVTYVEGEHLVVAQGSYTYSFKTLSYALSEMPGDFQDEFMRVVGMPTISALSKGLKLPGYFASICDGDRAADQIHAQTC